MFLKLLARQYIAYSIRFVELKKVVKVLWNFAQRFWVHTSRRGSSQ